MAGVIAHRVDLTPLLDNKKVSFNMVTSEEAVKEIRDYLNSKQAYIQPDGSLRLGCNHHIAALVLHNFSRGLVA